MDKRAGNLTRVLADGRVLMIYPMIYNARLVVSLSASDSCYEDAWCYQTLPKAIAAMHAWDPAIDKEPDGWIRHPNSGRRRPNGDKTREYVNP